MKQQAATLIRATTRIVTDIETGFCSSSHSGRALVYNISTDGCMIEGPDEDSFDGDVISLSFPNLPPIDGKVVWRHERYAGIQFATQLKATTVSRLGFKEPETRFNQSVPRDRFGRILPSLSGRAPF